MEWEKDPVTVDENQANEEATEEATPAEMTGEVEVSTEVEPEGQPECAEAEKLECQEEAEEPAETSTPEEPCCGESTEAAEPEADPAEIDPDSDASVPRE